MKDFAFTSEPRQVHVLFFDQRTESRQTNSVVGTELHCTRNLGRGNYLLTSSPPTDHCFSICPRTRGNILSSSLEVSGKRKKADVTHFQMAAWGKRRIGNGPLDSYTTLKSSELVTYYSSNHIVREKKHTHLQAETHLSDTQFAWHVVFKEVEANICYISEFRKIQWSLCWLFSEFIQFVLEVRITTILTISDSQFACDAPWWKITLYADQCVRNMSGHPQSSAHSVEIMLPIVHLAPPSGGKSWQVETVKTQIKRCIKKIFPLNTKQTSSKAATHFQPV